MMHVSQEQLTIETNGRRCYDITERIQSLVSHSSIAVGLCHIFIQHTSASLMINENADPTVLHDVEYFLNKWVIDGDKNYQHCYEGDDDMSAHIRHLLTQTELTIPIKQQQLLLGTWQGIYLYEHRFRPHSRDIIITIHGNATKS